MKFERLPITYEVEKGARIINPFHKIAGKYKDPYNEFTAICLENLTWAAYHLLMWRGKPLELAPFQSVILDVLWNKTFPLLLATRGGAKCIGKDSICQTSEGFKEIYDICEPNVDGATNRSVSMFGENGFNNTSFVWTNPPEKIYKITTSDGYEIRAVGRHRVRIIDDGEIKWKEMRDFTGEEGVVIDRSDSYNFNGPFNISDNEAYLIGAIIGDGGFTSHGKVGFTNEDKDILNEFYTNHKEIKYCTRFSSLPSDRLAYSILFGSKKNKDKFLDYYKIKQTTSHFKEIPKSILQSNKQALANFISGYADTDGGVLERKIEFSSASRKLICQLHVVLLSFGIISKFKHVKVKYEYKGKIKYNDAWLLGINRENSVIFRNKIGFRCKRKQDKLNAIIGNKSFNPNKDLMHNCKRLILELRDVRKASGILLGQELSSMISPWGIKKYNFSYAKVKKILNKCKCVSDSKEYIALENMYNKKYYFDKIVSVEVLPNEETYDVHIPGDHTFISNGFISHNTFMLAVYAVLRAMLTPGSKIVIVASCFRQSKLVFEYIEQLYEYSPLLRACCPRKIERPVDQRRLVVGTSSILALPLGNGEKIRGVRASVILCDEFSSIPQEIFQVVVRGFAAVSANPIEAAKTVYEEELAIKEGRMKEDARSKLRGNQIVYSGTANFQFNHFYKLYLAHKYLIDNKIIGSAKEVEERLKLCEEDSYLDGNLDYRDYAIVRIPYQGLPRGFMDEKQIAQARLTMPKALFQMEYECVFPTDSDGFFRRSFINAATPKPGFAIETHGQAGYEYIMGIDPARKTDNFAISVVKLMKDGKYRNVYCESMNSKRWPQATRKVRDILKKFNIVHISMDAGGGGTTVEDLLQDPNMLEPGESPIWRYDDDEAVRYEGRHILEMVNFSSAWIAEANYDLAADIEHRRCLFPNRTANKVTEADNEDVWMEIDEQINEMCMIVVTATKTGVQHFDTPEMPASQQGTLKTYQRKDRYSAILLAAHGARLHNSIDQRRVIPSIGGWADRL